MEASLFFTILVLAIGFYMAWNIGANDVANAMGTSVGSGALTLRKAVCIAAVLEFSGAFLAGSNVSETIQKGIIDTDLFLADPTLLILGMCAALLGTGAWLQIASYCGWPVSTTHAIVGAVAGFGIVIGGPEAVHWEQLSSIGASWVISPGLSALVSYFLFIGLQKKILYAMNPISATKRLFPYIVLLVFFVFSLSLLFNGLDHLNIALSFTQSLLLSLLIGTIAFFIAYLFIQKVKVPDNCTATPSTINPQSVVSLNKAVKHLQRVQSSTSEDTHEKVSHLLTEVRHLSQKLRKDSTLSDRTSQYTVVENVFVYLQILSACFIAFAHGANDVANSIGPVAAVMDVIKNGAVSEVSDIPPWLLAFGGAGIVVGLATWGWRVIETIGKKITELTPTRGFCAEFGAAATILVASRLGLPISTTHCLVGAVLGVGLAKGMKALNLGMLKEIILSWVITIPSSAVMSIGFFYILRMIFNYFFTGN
jgi:inorganic phosphate transporter, PiT family